MTVKRYTVAGTTGTPLGFHDYVLASDYDALAARCDARGEQIDLKDARIRELEAEVEALKHDLEKSMANHVADINGSASETEVKRV